MSSEQTSSTDEGLKAQLELQKKSSKWILS